MIIGGGPAGYVAAERAGHKGLKVILFEKKSMGGVCLNEGCIPTKTLLYSAKTYENALHGDKYGVYGENIRFDYGKIVARKNKVVRKLVAGVEGKMKMHHVTVVKGEAMIMGRSEKGVEVSSGGESYIGANLLICTGSEAFVPPIPGLAEAGDIILTNREILDLKEQPKSLVIIGGGVIGMEFASFYNSLGTEVTVVEMLPEILGQNDYEISAMLREMYAKKGINFNLNAKVVKIEGNKVFFEKDGETQIVEGEKILVSVGRRAVTKGFGLENLNVELLKGGIKVDEKMRTNIPGVFAAGDVTGFSLLAHTASREGEVVVNNLTGRADRMRYNA
ncbi:MAG: dihydrolipoamide dehydrogenase, partial [Bacteroidetes bacterium]|nr:dihydrolipoamide dehydrogenase [Bacteroidota bacterium]